MSDSMRPLEASFIAWAKQRMKQIDDEAEAAAKDLGLPKEAKYDLLPLIYGQAPSSSVRVPGALPRLLRAVTRLLNDVAQGVSRLDPMPVRLGLQSSMLGAEQPDHPPQVIGSFRLPLVSIQADGTTQRARVMGTCTPGPSGVSVEVRLFAYRVRGGDIPLTGYGIVLADTATGTPLSFAVTDATGTASFVAVAPDAVRHYVRLFVLSPSVVSTLPPVRD